MGAQVLRSGTQAAQESAAGVIWRACVTDPGIKDRLSVAIEGLVVLLRSGSPGGQVRLMEGLRFTVYGLRFTVYGLRFRVYGFGFRV